MQSENERKKVNERLGQPEVNFTNLMAQSTNESVGTVQFHQQKYALPYKYARLENMKICP